VAIDRRIAATAPERWRWAGLHHACRSRAHFSSISAAGRRAVEALGGSAVRAKSPVCPSRRLLRLVVAFDVIEHVTTTRAPCSELCPRAQARRALLMSVPLHSAHWTEFDALVVTPGRYDVRPCARFWRGTD